jgi:hypothetical protein
VLGLGRPRQGLPKALIGRQQARPRAPGGLEQVLVAEQVVVGWARPETRARQAIVGSEISTPEIVFAARDRLSTVESDRGISLRFPAHSALHASWHPRCASVVRVRRMAGAMWGDQAGALKENV